MLKGIISFYLVLENNLRVKLHPLSIALNPKQSLNTFQVVDNYYSDRGDHPVVELEYTHKFGP